VKGLCCRAKESGGRRQKAEDRSTAQSSRHIPCAVAFRRATSIRRRLRHTERPESRHAVGQRRFAQGYGTRSVPTTLPDGADGRNRLASRLPIAPARAKIAIHETAFRYRPSTRSVGALREPRPGMGRRRLPIGLGRVRQPGRPSDGIRREACRRPLEPDARTRRRLGVARSQLLTEDWRASNANDEEARTQSLGRLAWEAAWGCEGVLVPSAADAGGVPLGPYCSWPLLALRPWCRTMNNTC